MNLKKLLTSSYLLFFFTAPLSAENIGNNKVDPSKDIESRELKIQDLGDKIIFDKEILKEKPVIISFFYVGCKPCEKEIAELVRLNELYKDKIKIFLISNSKLNFNTVKQYLKSKNFTLETLEDKNSEMALAFGVKKYPSLFIINQDELIIFSCSGYTPVYAEKIKKVLHEIIKTD